MPRLRRTSRNKCGMTFIRLVEIAGRGLHPALWEGRPRRDSPCHPRGSHRRAAAEDLCSVGRETEDAGYFCEIPA